MNRLLQILLLAFTSVMILSCVGGKAVERSYFSLQYLLSADDRVDRPPLPVKIRVKRCTAGIAYDRQEIVYRSNPHEFRYYWYKLWAAKPEKLVREQTMTHLKHTGLFEEIDGRLSNRRPDYELSCHINALEELDSVNGRWFAHLDLTFTLTNHESGQRVIEKRYAEKKEVFERRPVFVVRALSELLQKQVEALAYEMASEVGNVPPPSVTEPPAAPPSSPKASLRKN